MVRFLRCLLVLVAACFFVAVPLVAEDGLLDGTFSSDGLLLIGWSAGTQPDQAYAVGAFPDGSLFAAGDVEVVSSNARASCRASWRP